MIKKFWVLAIGMLNNLPLENEQIALCNLFVFLCKLASKAGSWGSLGRALRGFFYFLLLCLSVGI